MENKLNTLLRNLITAFPAVEMIEVVDRNGLPFSSLIANEEDELIIGSLTATFDAFMERMKKEFTGEEFYNTMVFGDKKFFIASAGKNAILTMVGNKDVADSEMLVYGQFTVDKIKVLFENAESVSLEIPKLLNVISKFKDGKLPSGQYSAKIIVCGDYKVGKTSLIRRFVDNSFLESYLSTIGVDITKKDVKLTENCSITFLLWDIGGQIQQMIPYRKRFYSGANCAFLVFDKTRRGSFDGIKTWLSDIDNELKENIPKILIGNKNDLKNDFQVSTEDLEELAEELGLEYIETSAKTGENVSEAFIYMAYKTVNR